MALREFASGFLDGFGFAGLFGHIASDVPDEELEYVVLTEADRVQVAMDILDRMKTDLVMDQFERRSYDVTLSLMTKLFGQQTQERAGSVISHGKG